MEKPSFLRTQEHGFISAIILIVIGLITLQFAFKIDILALLQSPRMVAISDVVIKYALIVWHWLVGFYKSLSLISQ